MVIRDDRRKLYNHMLSLSDAYLSRDLQWERLKRLLFEDKPEWFGTKIWQSLRNSPTLLLTVLYILISGMGLCTQYALFSRFGINALDYSETEDFFLAALKIPEGVFFGILIIVTFILYRKIANFAVKLRYRVVRYFLLIFFFWFLFRREILIPLGILYYLYIFDFMIDLQTWYLIHQSTDIVTVTTDSDGAARYSIIPIGSTNSFFFGIEFTDDFQKAREKNQLTFKPSILGIPFDDIKRLNYAKSEYQTFFPRSPFVNNQLRESASPDDTPLMPTR